MPRSESFTLPYLSNRSCCALRSGTTSAQGKGDADGPSRQEGTRRVYFIDPHGLGALRRWLDQFWDEALAAFQAEVELGKSEQKDRDK